MMAVRHGEKPHDRTCAQALWSIVISRRRICNTFIFFPTEIFSSRTNVYNFLRYVKNNIRAPHIYSSTRSTQHIQVFLCSCCVCTGENIAELRNRTETHVADVQHKTPGRQTHTHTWKISISILLSRKGGRRDGIQKILGRLYQMHLRHWRAQSTQTYNVKLYTSG